VNAGSRARRALERLARVDLRPKHRAAQGPRPNVDGADLLRAIKHGELTLHFQPIAELRTGQCRRVEALVRWTHPSVGPVAPRDIVRLAESTGSLVVLALWVVGESARRRVEWAHDGLELGVGVNLTGPELLGPGPATLLAAIVEAGAHASAFTFEVPGAALVTEGASMRAGLRALSTAGARIAVDDVSPANMPPRSMAVDFDEVKIARSLVLRAVADEDAGVTVRAMVEHARDLGLATVAVGVEDDATYRLVSAYGYDLAQGFWMSRPLASRDVSRWRGWMARIALGGAAAIAVPLGMVRMPFGGGGATATASLVGTERGAQCCTRAAPGEPTADLGLAMTTTQVEGARVLAEASMSADDVGRIRAALERDLAATQEMLGSTFDRAPRVYVLATRASFSYAVQRGFGQSANEAGILAAGNGGVAFPKQSAIVVNWEAVRGDTSLSILRHELTHVLVHQLAGFDTDLPAWFDEGLATLAEREAGAEDIDGARATSATLALLAQGRGSLAALSSPREWTPRNAELDGRGYTVASTAVELLAQNGGTEGFRRLLMRANDVGFAGAFAALRGESVADFTNAFPARFAAQNGTPRITQRPYGSSVQWSVSGLRADSTVKVTIDGLDYHLEFDARTDRDGVYTAVFGQTARAGEYSLTVFGRGMRASTQLRVP
jgi:EAL domain-containing protein (putative c-di-GMP-specific phosphodiesterase class I)